MKVRGRDRRATWWSDDGVAYLDQRRLPHALVEATARSVAEAAHAIRDMGVRGAPAIGVFAAYALALAARRGEPIDAARACLLATRPTAVNLRAGLDAVARAAPDPDAMLAAARAYDAAEVAAAEAIGRHGLPLVGRGARVLTHCNAGWLAVQDWGSALAPVYKAARAGLDPFVWVSETRPRLQGARLTAWELGEEGVRHALVADGAVADRMRRGEVDLVLTGADRIAANGDVANKIGTYAHACAAQVHGVPFYVAAPRTTIDRAIASGAEIPIEERPADELLFVEGVAAGGDTVRVRVAAPGAAAINPAFDVTPARFIAGIVTEVGIVPATAAGIAGAFGAPRR
jgi:methylthioribose-1-phosphate isomerase